MLEQWALALGFLGVVIAIVIQYKTLTQEQGPKYRRWLQATIILIGFCTSVQIYKFIFGS